MFVTRQFFSDTGYSAWSKKVTGLAQRGKALSVTIDRQSARVLLVSECVASQGICVVKIDFATGATLGQMLAIGSPTSYPLFAMHDDGWIFVWGATTDTNFRSNGLNQVTFILSLEDELSAYYCNRTTSSYQYFDAIDDILSPTLFQAGVFDF